MTARRPRHGALSYRHPIEVRYGDTDALGHVNNAVYLSYFEAARAGYYAAVTGRPFGTGTEAERHLFVIAEACVRYRAPAFFGESLVCEAGVTWVSRSAFGIAYRLLAEGGPIAPARTIAEGETVQVMIDAATERAARVPTALRAAIEAYEGRALPTRRED
jgi:acyl-CoA thioester hydrolase